MTKLGDSEDYFFAEPGDDERGHFFFVAACDGESKTHELSN